MTSDWARILGPRGSAGLQMLRRLRPHPAPSPHRRQRAPCAAPARSPAFRLGCGRLGAAGSPALPLRGVLCPLVRCLLLSLARGWQPLLQLVACGAEVARAVGSGACQSPSAVPLVPAALTFNPPLPGGLMSASQTVGWVREGRRKSLGSISANAPAPGPI